MKRSGFKRKIPDSEGKSLKRTRSFPTPEPGAFRTGVAVSIDACHVAKPQKYRNPSLLKLARGEPCMLRIPGVCNGDTATSVQCHSNLGIHGKGGGTKAHDCCSFSGCSACHHWLDQSNAPSYGQKHAATMLALERQIYRWHHWMLHTKKYSEKHLVAARWACVHLLAIDAECSQAFNDEIRSALKAVDVQLLQYCNN